MAVQVTRKRMKSIRLKVTPLGEVHVSVPYGVSDEEICRLIESRKDWITAQKRAFESSPQAEAEGATKEEQAAWRRVGKACIRLSAWNM